MDVESKDQKTADAFAESWNHLPGGSVYTLKQFKDWMHPVVESVVRGKRVLELGCGNGSLLVHMAGWEPAYLEGVDLGDSVRSAKKNLCQLVYTHWKVVQSDLTTYTSPEPFDVAYCIGVLHHLKNPKQGLDSVVRNTRVGGRFHCWVYAHEGNAVIRYVVDPIRAVTSQLPWRITKYMIATPLTVPFYIYAKLLAAMPGIALLRALPLYDYSLWIAQRDFLFFRHVAFDQLVTPQTAYIPRSDIESWLSSYVLEEGSTYIINRNGNSWKFGGRRKA